MSQYTEGSGKEVSGTQGLVLVFVRKGAGGLVRSRQDPFVQDQGWACGRRSGGLDAGFVGLVAVLIS